jgi:hypothetical protein
MATGKRFYWMKLKESFMTSDTIDYFMSQPDGANYVVLYQMLCLKTINTDGRLSRQIGEVVIKYDIPKIQRDLKWFSADTIRVALNLYKSFGLVYEDIDGVLVLADHNNLVGCETDWGEKKRRQRNSPALQSGDNVPTDVPTTVPTEIENRDRDKEIRDKSLDKDTDIEDTEDSCAEPVTVSAPPIISIILNDKTFFNVFPEDYNRWCELYPAVNVMQELRKMSSWSTDNPKRRKTKSGIRRFINAWLSKEQDKGGQYRYQGGISSGNVFTDIAEGMRNGQA